MMSNDSSTKSFYDEFFAYMLKDRIYPNPRHLRIFEYLGEIFESRNIKSALEIGCGIGIISEEISKHVPDVTSIDIGENNVKFASLTVDNVNFICSDFLNANLNRKFDLITLFDVLEHFPKNSHQQVFEKIRDYSYDDTLLAITIPDPHCLDYFREHSPDILQVIDESIHFHEMMKLLRDFNLELKIYRRFRIDYEDQYRYFLLNYRRENYTLRQPEGNPRKRSLPARAWHIFKKYTLLFFERIRAGWRKARIRKILKSMHKSGIEIGNWHN